MFNRVYRRTHIPYWVPCYDCLELPEGVDPTDELAVSKAVFNNDTQWETIFADFDGVTDVVGDVAEQPENCLIPFSELPKDVQEYILGNK